MYIILRQTNPVRYLDSVNHWVLDEKEARVYYSLSGATNDVIALASSYKEKICIKTLDVKGLTP